MAVNILRSRIMYDQNGYSQKFRSAKGVFQVHLDVTAMNFRIINATNNLKLFEKSGTKSLHVLKRWAKKELQRISGLNFAKEKRPARLGMKTWQKK